MKQTYQGLTTNEAQRRLEKYGPNELPKDKPKSFLVIFFRQLKSPLIYVLLFAALISFLLNHFNDALIIGFTVLINSLIGFFQEYRAQKELFALRSLFSPKARVWRDGEKQEIESRYLVPGDLVMVRLGEKVPGDAMATEVKDLLVNEAVLTGESKEVEKQAEQKSKIDDFAQVKVVTSNQPSTRDFDEASKQLDTSSQLFMGTEVVQGWVKAVVIRTGLKTEMGKIALMLRQTEEEETPLQRKIKNLSKKLAVIFVFLSLVVFILGLIIEKPVWDLLTTSVALGVSAIPEGLAVSLTVILALGMQRIFKRQALVRRLISAETLGSVTTICTDKTGTLTEGKMKVVHWQVNNEEAAIQIVSLCNNLTGPLELALWDYVKAKNHLDPQQVTENYGRIDEVPFSSRRKYMAVLVREGEPVILAKGAPEIILSWCKIGVQERQEWLDLAEEWGNEGIRVLALAKRSCPPTCLPRQNQPDQDQKINDWRAYLEVGFEFIGLVGFSDPLRIDVKESLLVCQQAGIKVMMITGDFRATAENIGQKLGFFIKPEEIIEGAELRKLSEEEFLKRAGKVKLFVRTSPEDKLKIVEVLKKSGQIVAMTGDGVNDAPALKKADVGIVVGSATEVARETADLVLLDSSFKTIVAAIEEGRAIFDNLRKIVLYLLSDSFSEIILLVLSFMAGLPLPLLASQILWINFIDDGPTSLALTVDPKEKGLMQRPPRDPKVLLIDREMQLLISLISGFTGIASFFIFIFVYKILGDLNLARATTFTFLSLDSVLYVYSCKTLRSSIFKTGAFNNQWLNVAVVSGIILTALPLYVPFLRNLLRLSPLQAIEWVMVMGASLLLILLIETVKHLFNIKNQKLKIKNTN